MFGFAEIEVVLRLLEAREMGQRDGDAILHQAGGLHFFLRRNQIQCARSSSLPQRPQLESSVSHRLTCSIVAPGVAALDCADARVNRQPPGPSISRPDPRITANKKSFIQSPRGYYLELFGKRKTTQSLRGLDFQPGI